MRNATASQPVHVAPIGNWLRYGIAVVVAAIIAALAFQALDPAPPVAEPALTSAQQAWADRLTGLAERPDTGDRPGAEAGFGPAQQQIDAHESPEVVRVPAPTRPDPHESPEIGRVPAKNGPDVHESPEIVPVAHPQPE